MKKLILIVFSLFLVGCGTEEITGSFKLSAADGYQNRPSAVGTPHTYIIDTNSKEVFVDVIEEGFTKEDLEAIEEMSEEEFADFINNQPIYEEPLYAIDFIEATKDEIILEYEGERETFTALSETYFEREDGMRFVIEYDSSVEDYQNSFMDY